MQISSVLRLHCKKSDSAMVFIHSTSFPLNSLHIALISNSPQRALQLSLVIGTVAPPSRDHIVFRSGIALISTSPQSVSQVSGFMAVKVPVFPVFVHVGTVFGGALTSAPLEAPPAGSEGTVFDHVDVH